MSAPPRSPNGAQTETLARGVVKHAPFGAIVRVVGAAATPSSFRLTSGTCMVGSAAPCDLVIAEPTVSREHAELHLVPEGVAIRDLGSRNGTFYLGQRVEKMVLSFGARVEVGKATLAIDPDTPELDEGAEYPHDDYRGIVGRSSPMRRLFSTLTRLEGSLVTILLEGESGVGKEVVARAIHEASPVGDRPLVTLNCGAIPRDLVASELFGHRKGAFTGAVEHRVGAFSEADGGTLFLDEIGELPLDIQPALLRALECGEIRAVGGGRPEVVKVRILAATNRDLEGQVRAGLFREDLFYRIAVVRLRVRPLRERIEDVEPLAVRFAGALGIPALPADVLERLKARSYDGNVRELKNVLQAYAALGALPEPTRSKLGTLALALGDFVDPSRPYAEQKDELAEQFTKAYVEALLSRTKGNQTVAARVAGLDRSYFGRLVAKHRLGRSG